MKKKKTKNKIVRLAELSLKDFMNRSEDTVLNYFGSDRIVWGSDWPVVLGNGNYKNWFDICYSYIQSGGDEALYDVFYRTSSDFYRIEKFQ